jgi:hypothetical protein
LSQNKNRKVLILSVELKAKIMATRKRQTKGALHLPEHQNVTVVHSREEFEREAQRLRDSGYTEVPGYLGGGHGDSIKADYADYI